jgi:phenylacetate-CoA ligase
VPSLAFRSDDPQVIWPAVPDTAGAYYAALQYQLEQSQWWTPDRLLAQQFLQLNNLASHAYRTVPFYKERLAAAGYETGIEVTPALWSRLPVLTRRDVQQAGAALNSGNVPAAHGSTAKLSSSGSTGTPVTVSKTQAANLVWQAITLRDHLWHRRDFMLPLCLIRKTESFHGSGKGQTSRYPNGIVWNSWGGAASRIFRTGRSAALHIETAVELQAEWLERKQPGTLVTYPTNLLDLTKFCRDQEIRLPNLHSLSTLGEVVTPELRELCREVWGLAVQDIYSAVETGYIALQCPSHDHYHLQGEAALVEILDDDGRTCGPGEIGRVVVTPLHNFATPLLRYAVGDYAEVGEACRCGRGLPVITRILGRSRNMMTLPSGERIWPLMGIEELAALAPIRQLQLVQRSLRALELRLVPERPLTATEEDGLLKALQRRWGGAFEIALTCCQSIARDPSGKFEDFKSEVV